MDVIPEKVDKVNARISPIQDDYIEKYFKEKKLDLVATLDGASPYIKIYKDYFKIEIREVNANAGYVNFKVL